MQNILVILIFLILYFSETVSCSQGWPRLLILRLPLPSYYKCVPPHPAGDPHYNHPGGNEVILKRPCTLPFNYQTIETMNSKRLEFPHESHTARSVVSAEGWACLSESCSCDNCQSPCRANWSPGNGDKQLIPWPRLSPYACADPLNLNVELGLKDRL